MSESRNIEDLYPRAPRYSIEVGDEEVLRFAHMPAGSKTMHTRILNLSESGLAFLSPVLAAPEIDEKIKVQFKAPNTDSIACYARVVRVENHRSYHKDRPPQSFRLVAIQFEQLPSQQRQNLTQGLEEQFRKKRIQYQRQQMLLRFQWLGIHFFDFCKRFIQKLFRRDQ